ncbi:hypothetical protein [Chitinophaga filiformis]|uniref:Uncharacterized protein n=1 Tax=Chitinophaga filiformis TaxID=104663 RepID=A0A1G7XB76_CHIFI|nr:hypothetical protein [Chitinophaga filiformis]SDG81479.1 hypothetical protein SAMN04488121_106381 [Chitinophaga filiformis]
MKRIIAILAFLLPLAIHAQTKLEDKLAEDFSNKFAKRYEVRNDSLIVFVTEQMSRSGAAGLDIDKTMTELQKDPAALDAALKFIYQYSNANRQQFIAHLRAMNLQSNSVFPLATYAVNKFKGETKELLEEKSSLYTTGAIPATLPPLQITPAVAENNATTSDPNNTTTSSSNSETTASTAVPAEPGATPTTPAAPASPAADNFNWDVRQIFKLRQPDQLYALYGKEHVEARQAQDFQGNDIGTAYYVFPDTDNEMIVQFDGEKGTSVFFTKENSKWKPPFGIKVGDPLDKVVKVNGRDFRIHGFEWENGGEVADWEGGAFAGKGVNIAFKANNSSDPKLYDQVTGDKKVKTDASAMKKLAVVVDKIAFKSN